VSNPDENILPVIATGRGNSIAADVREAKETRYGFWKSDNYFFTCHYIFLGFHYLTKLQKNVFVTTIQM